MGGGLSGHCFLGKNFQEKLKGSHNHLEFIETAQTPQSPFFCLQMCRARSRMGEMSDEWTDKASSINTCQHSTGMKEQGRCEGISSTLPVLRSVSGNKKLGRA